MSHTRWSGRLFYAGRWTLYVGPVAPTELHAHHAHQIVLATPALAMRDAQGATTRTSHVVIPANAPHAIDAPHPRAVVLFVDDEQSPAGDDAALAATWDARGRVLDAIPTDLADTSVAAARALAAQLLDALALSAPRAEPHPALEAARRAIEDALPGPVRAATIASHVAMSSSRLMHVFREGLGISLRGYVRWARVRRAVDALQRGGSLSVAAHDAGFADAAHLTRTFRTMFGFAPSALTSGAEWVLVDGE